MEQLKERLVKDGHSEDFIEKVLDIAEEMVEELQGGDNECTYINL